MECTFLKKGPSPPKSREKASFIHLCQDTEVFAAPCLHSAHAVLSKEFLKPVLSCYRAFTLNAKLQGAHSRNIVYPAGSKVSPAVEVRGDVCLFPRSTMGGVETNKI